MANTSAVTVVSATKDSAIKKMAPAPEKPTANLTGARKTVRAMEYALSTEKLQSALVNQALLTMV